MSAETLDVDVAVVGGGIAGVSVAAELARFVTVAVLEQEQQLGYHATGRSAAAFLESYGSPEIRALTRASRPLFDQPDRADEPPLLTPRPLLWLSPPADADRLTALVAAESALRELDEAGVRELCPAVRPGWLAVAAVEPGAQDLDVAALFDRYRRRAQQLGVTFVTSAPVTAVGAGAPFELAAGGRVVRAPIVVNAAGAWADEVARTLGAQPLGVTPFRRTIAIASPSTAAPIDPAWPLVCDLGERFYFRPEGDGLLLSPADETLSAPMDARAATEDVALALDQVNEATTLNLRHIRHTWAGLRTFAPDRNPVVGFDPGVPGLFWLAGQGGYGMQTAPAVAQLAAALIRSVPPPPALLDTGLDPTHLSPSPSRFP